MQLHAVLAAAVCAVAFPALSTPQPIDATDLWINPAEPGWGLNLIHQGDTLFGSLFVYGPNGLPKWYTASSLTGGPSVYTGPLIEATGPWFGASSFDPGAVSRRVVGGMTVTLNDTDATLTYSVDGVQVTKRISRFSMRPINLGSLSYGVELQPASVSGTEIAVLDQHINLQDDGSTLTMSTDSNRTSSCAFNGARGQNGEMVGGTGSYSCPGRSGPWSMAVDLTPHGFVGLFSGNGIAQGRIAAAMAGVPAMQGNGWINDLWFPPGESGWGLNLIEQGDTAFATLFVYDGLGMPHWYSASRLMASIQGGRPAWFGSLEETTGPYFGGTFNPSAIARRIVGTMSFQVAEDGSGLLGYQADNVVVNKRVSRYAFRRNDLSGSYQGHVVMRADDPRGLSYDDAAITIDDQGDRVSLVIDIATGPRCNYAGQSIQYGAQRSVAGTFTCQSGLQGTFRMDDLMVTVHGFTGTYQGPAGHIGGLITNGHISGARR